MTITPNEPNIKFQEWSILSTSHCLSVTTIHASLCPTVQNSLYHPSHTLGVVTMHLFSPDKTIPFITTFPKFGLTKFKAFASSKLTHRWKSFENMVGKRENVYNHHFSTMFSALSNTTTII